MKIAPRPTNPQIVYAHPDGEALVFHPDAMYLAVHSDYYADRDDFIGVPIGPDGLIALGLALIAAGHAINVKGGA